MGETDFALTCSSAIVIDDFAVYFKQLGRHITKTCCGWYRQTAFHIGCNCCGYTAQRFRCRVSQNLGRCNSARCRWLHPRRCRYWFDRLSDSTVYIFWWQQKRSQNFGCVINPGCTRRAKIAEELLPSCANRGWVIAILLVHLFDEPRVGAKFLGLRAVKHRIYSTLNRFCDTAQFNVTNYIPPAGSSPSIPCI